MRDTCGLRMLLPRDRGMHAARILLRHPSHLLMRHPTAEYWRSWGCRVLT